MTDRYVSAASVSALLHGVVIALLVMFSLHSRRELTDISREAVFVLTGSTLSTATVPDQGLPLVLPSIPVMRPVVIEPAAPVETHDTVTPPPKTSPRGSKVRTAPPKPPKPLPNVRPPVTVSPPRVGETWQFGPAAGSHNSATPTAVSNQAMVPNASDRDAYFAEVRRLLQAALLVPPGMPARLNATVQFFLAADGTLSRAKMVSPSGNAVFDRAVLEAIARTRAPARPDGTGELMETTLATRAER